MTKDINLKNVELSKEKTTEVEDTIVKLIKESTIRKFFVPKKYIKENHEQLEFKKLGINSITNKEWFVDDKETAPTYWEYKQLPWTYAVSLEEGEEEMVIKKIIGSIPNHNKIKLTQKEHDEKKKLSREKIEEFDSALEDALSKIPNADVIITNVYDSHKFFLNREKFTHIGRTLKRGADIMGEYISHSGKRLPIYTGRMIPKWITLIMDTKTIGTFLIKEKNGKDIYAKVSKIEENEREEIKKNLGLTDVQLDNRSRIYIEEIVTFKINDVERAVLIENVNHDHEN